MPDDTLARIAPSIALQPWERRPDEPFEDWLGFLAWLLTRPRAPVLPEGARAAAIEWEWHRRAAMAESALAPQDDPAAMSRRIAMRLLTITDREVGARCGESLRDPGRMPLPELFKLVTMLHDFKAAIPAAAVAAQSRFDVTKLTREELFTYSYLAAKAYVPADE